MRKIILCLNMPLGSCILPESNIDSLKVNKISSNFSLVSCFINQMLLHCFQYCWGGIMQVAWSFSCLRFFFLLLLMQLYWEVLTSHLILGWLERLHKCSFSLIGGGSLVCNQEHRTNYCMFLLLLFAFCFVSFFSTNVYRYKKNVWVRSSELCQS